MDHQEIIARYLTGGSSGQENEQLLSWVRANDDHQEEFVELCKVWHLSDKKAEIFDTAAAYSRFKAKISLADEAGKTVEMNVETHKQRKFNMKLYAVSAAASIVIALGVLLFNRNPKIECYANNSGKVETITLADGTISYLNKSTNLDAPVKFKGKNRTVELRGEAYFEVVKDASKPFVITVGDAKVTVVGTSFNIMQDSITHNCTVIVNTGVVKLQSNKGEATLTPGEKGEFDAGTGGITETVNDDINFISWKTGVLQFDNTRLNKVVLDVQKYYGIKMSVDPSIKESELLTAKFDNQPIETVFKTIELALNVKIKEQNNVFVLTKNN